VSLSSPLRCSAIALPPPPRPAPSPAPVVVIPVVTPVQPVVAPIPVVVVTQPTAPPSEVVRAPIVLPTVTPVFVPPTVVPTAVTNQFPETVLGMYTALGNKLRFFGTRPRKNSSTFVGHFARAGSCPPHKGHLFGQPW
jgi:hypothetical protein